MRHTTMLAVLVSVLWSSLGTLAAAQGLSPERFVRADIEAREATLVGMEARLALLQRHADNATQEQLEDVNRRRVTTVFTRYGTTGSAHAAYGTQHRTAIAAWLEAHPEWQRRYAAVAARFDQLSQQIDAVVKGH